MVDEVKSQAWTREIPRIFPLQHARFLSCSPALSICESSPVFERTGDDILHITRYRRGSLSAKTMIKFMRGMSRLQADSSVRIETTQKQKPQENIPIVNYSEPALMVSRMLRK